MERMIARRGSTNVIELRRLLDVVDNQYQEDATVTCTLFDLTGSPVAGAQDIEMVYVPGTTGRDVLYLGELSYGVSLPNAFYIGIVTADASSGARRKFPPISVKVED